MTREEAREKQAQIEALEAELNQFRRDVNAESIINVEDKYVGRYFIKNKHRFSQAVKPHKEEEPTVYLKVISAITGTYGIRVHCFEFEPELRTKFLHAGDFSIYRANKNPFDYVFDDEPSIWIDTEMVEDLDKYKEIEEPEFMKAFSHYCNNLSKFLKQDFTMKEYFGGHYVEEIRSKSTEQNQE